MSDVGGGGTATGLDESGVTVDAAALADGFAGEVVTPADEEYRHARRVWNGMINRYPAVVARCADVTDVRAAVAFARERDLPLAVKGGGHGVSGGATVDGGVVVDLSPMDAVRVDPEARTVRAEGGATWADVDRATQAFGLATPGGVVSDTGVAGLTLGGGLGHLRRKYGASCDNVRSFDVVTADGEFLTARAGRNADLYWALRGGGGNFGVVTSFEFDCHPVGPEVAVCFVWYPIEECEAVLDGVRDYAASAPEEVSLVPFTAFVPPLPEFPAEAHGDPAIAVLGAHAGDADVGTRELRSVRVLGEPVADLGGPMPYVQLQSMLDADYPEGRLYYWKSVYLDELTDAAVALVGERGPESPSALSTVDLWQLGGALGEVPEGATAFAHRDAGWLLNFEANWDDPRETAANVEWVRDGVEAARELDAADGLYVNFPGFGEDPAREAFGDSYDRLAAVKAEYDPEDVFRGNRAVAPGTGV